MRLLSILLLLAIPWTATGQVEEHAPPAHSVMQQCSGVTLGDAVEQVRRQYNGRIVSAETLCSGNCEVHVIKVLTADGKVKTVRVPGNRCG